MEPCEAFVIAISGPSGAGNCCDHPFARSSNFSMRVREPGGEESRKENSSSNSDPGSYETWLPSWIGTGADMGQIVS